MVFTVGWLSRLPQPPPSRPTTKTTSSPPTSTSTSSYCHPSVSPIPQTSHLFFFFYFIKDAYTYCSTKKRNRLLFLNSSSFAPSALYFSLLFVPLFHLTQLLNIIAYPLAILSAIWHSRFGTVRQHSGPGIKTFTNVEIELVQTDTLGIWEKNKKSIRK